MAQLFIKYALTGGGNDALDGIDGNNIYNGDLAWVINNQTHYFYILDNDSGATESSPNTIKPDSNAGDKRWVLLTITQQQEIQDDLTLQGLTVENDAKIKGLLTVLASASISDDIDIGKTLTVGGDTDLQSALTVAGFLQLNNDMEATGNIEAAGFTIDGEPVGQSTDTFWNSDGSGNIYYRSGNILGNPIALNKYEITSNWEIPSGYHGMSVGPLDIDADITIAENSVWEVL